MYDKLRDAEKHEERLEFVEALKIFPLSIYFL